MVLLLRVILSIFLKICLWITFENQKIKKITKKTFLKEILVVYVGNIFEKSKQQTLIRNVLNTILTNVVTNE